MGLALLCIAEVHSKTTVTKLISLMRAAQNRVCYLQRNIPDVQFCASLSFSDDRVGTSRIPVRSIYSASSISVSIALIPVSHTRGLQAAASRCCMQWVLLAVNGITEENVSQRLALVAIVNSPIR
eukprot:9167-Heterococcus_DN1.PRE.2